MSSEVSVRQKIVLEVLQQEYPRASKDVLEALADDIDTRWHIIKRRSINGENGEWTLSGQLSFVIWDELAEGAQSVAAAHKILARMAKEGVR